MREETVDRIIDYLKAKEEKFHEYSLESTDAKTVSPREMYAYIRSEIMTVRHFIERSRE